METGVDPNVMHCYYEVRSGIDNPAGWSTVYQGARTLRDGLAVLRANARGPFDYSLWSLGGGKAGKSVAHRNRRLVRYSEGSQPLYGLRFQPGALTDYEVLEELAADAVGRYVVNNLIDVTDVHPDSANAGREPREELAAEVAEEACDLLLDIGLVSGDDKSVAVVWRALEKAYMDGGL